MKLVFCVQIWIVGMALVYMTAEPTYAQSTVAHSLALSEQQNSQVLNKHNAVISTQLVVDGLTRPWAVKSDAFGRYWITLMTGEVVIFNAQNQQKRSVDLTLPELYVDGQGGLLDIILLDTNSPLVQEALVSFAQGDATNNRLAIQKVTFTQAEQQLQLTQSQPLFAVSKDKNTPVHFAGRMLLLDDNTLLLSSGDGFDYREDAQHLDSQLGKTLRMTLDGTPVATPPFVQHPYVFTWGHRNGQGLARDNQGNIWMHEHGPAGGDEINQLKAGANYGWPIATTGKDYSGAQISPFDHYSGMQPPIFQWTPSIAPSSMIYREGEHSLWITTLVSRTITTFDLHTQTETELALDVDERLRDIHIDYNQDTVVLTDGEDGRLLRLTR